MHTRQLQSFEDAVQYMEERGELSFHGRAGRDYEYCVYTIKLFSGKRYRVNIYDDGKVEVFR